MTESSISMSFADFKSITEELYFCDPKKLTMSISCKEGDIYIKMILEDSNISTYYLNDSLVVDSTDILIMFDYKYIYDVINKTTGGTITFKLNKSTITMIIKSDITIKLNFNNNIEEHILGEIDIQDTFLKIDSSKLYSIFNYFLKPIKNLSNFIPINYLYITVKDTKIIFNKDSLTIELDYSTSINITDFKVHIDYVCNFISKKKYLMDVYITDNFPIVCKIDSTYGKLEFWSSPIT